MERRPQRRGGAIARYVWTTATAASPSTTRNPTTSHTMTPLKYFAASLTVTNTAGTSTKTTFTGRVVSNNGQPSAELIQAVIIRSLPYKGGLASIPPPAAPAAPAAPSPPHGNGLASDRMPTAALAKKGPSSSWKAIVASLYGTAYPVIIPSGVVEDAVFLQQGSFMGTAITPDGTTALIAGSTEVSVLDLTQPIITPTTVEGFTNAGPQFRGWRLQAGFHHLSGLNLGQEFRLDDCLDLFPPRSEHLLEAFGVSPATPRLADSGYPVPPSFAGRTQPLLDGR